MNGMKRGIILFAALLVAGMTAEAQTQNTFGGGDIVLSAGIGAGTALNIGNTVVPPIVIQGEYGIVDNLFDAYSSIGVSGYMGFAAGRKSFYYYPYDTYRQKINSFLLGVRGTFHYQFVERLDTYAGITLGGEIANVREEGRWWNGQPPRYGGFLADVFIGARYYVVPQALRSTESSVSGWPILPSVSRSRYSGREIGCFPGRAERRRAGESGRPAGIICFRHLFFY